MNRAFSEVLNKSTPADSPLFSTHSALADASTARQGTTRVVCP